MTANSIPSLIQHQVFPQFCEDLGITIKLQKLDFVLKQKSRYLGILINTDLEKVFPTDSINSKLRDCRVLSVAPFSGGMDVAVAFWPHGISKTLCSIWTAQDKSLSVVAQDALVVCSG